MCAAMQKTLNGDREESEMCDTHEPRLVDSQSRRQRSHFSETFDAEVVDPIAACPGANDRRFERAAGDAPFRFVSALLDLETASGRECGLTTCAADLRDRFSDKSVRTTMTRSADQQFDAILDQLEEIRFVNLMIDSETIHSLAQQHIGCRTSSGLF
jgi:hypothetical protein